MWGAAPRRGTGLATALAAVGRTLIILGLVILGFVAYQLLGTNVAESRSQAQLLDGFAVVVPAASLEVSTPSGEPAPPPPPDGQAVARILIPKIGVDKAVIEGTDLRDLRKGPGHYKGTPLPGQPGNVAIAGHRTTYGAPFFRLDELAVGDPVLVSTVQGAFRYEVREVRVVKPSEVQVVAPASDNRLTLTTCNPRFSAAERLVVVADLKGPAAAPSPQVVRTLTPEAPEASPPSAPPSAPPAPAPEVVGASGDPAAQQPAALWGLATLAIGLAAWALGRRWRRLPAWTLAALPLLASLWQFYTYLARALPS